MRRTALAVLVSVGLTIPLAPLWAEVAQDPSDLSGTYAETGGDIGLAKFRVDGATLIYDTETTVEGDEAEITTADAGRLRDVLRATEGVRVLELNSVGGSVFASEQMARIVLDFELDTIVSGSCVSSCVTIFLAGKSRRMMLGSQIGFHRWSWSGQSMQEYYEDQKAVEEWATPFDFASWVFEDAQAETYKYLDYLLRRGVDPVFAIRTRKVAAETEWYPTRLEMLQAGVLTE